MFFSLLSPSSFSLKGDHFCVHHNEVGSLRGKREFTDAILNAMGGIDRARFSQYKALLQLSDEAMELADRHNIDEYPLRFVLQLSENDQSEMVQQIIQFNLSGRQVKQICEKGIEDPDIPTNSSQSAYINRFVKSMKQLNTDDEQEFVAQLVRDEKSLQHAQSQLDETIEFLIRVKSRLSQI